MAELIAIIVCSLIVIAFILVCIIMIRNAQKQRRMVEAAKIAKDEIARVSAHEESQSKGFAVTQTIQNRSRSITAVVQSSEYDSEEGDEVEDFSAYGNQKNI